MHLSNRGALFENRVLKLGTITEISVVGAIIGISMPKANVWTASMLATVIDAEIAKTEASFFAFEAVVT